jgi:hypothetical protein
VPLANFREQSAPILAETEMQELWIDAVLEEDARTADAVEAAGAQFQAWLSEKDNRRRIELEAEANHAKLRRLTRAIAIEHRRRPPNGMSS